MARALKSGIAEAAGRATSNIELPWRVLSLLNVFRLLLPMYSARDGREPDVEV